MARCVHLQYGVGRFSGHRLCDLRGRISCQILVSRKKTVCHYSVYTLFHTDIYLGAVVPNCTQNWRISFVAQPLFYHRRNILKTQPK